MIIKILLADDHKLMRDGLRALIEKQTTMEVAGEAEDGKNTVQLVRKKTPDVVIMDVGMPELNGIEATRQIKAENPDIKIIALSMHSDKRFITRMLSAGASGYLLKDCAFDELINAIQTVNQNQLYLSQSIANTIVMDHISRLKETDTSVYTVLTEREREVLQLLAEGHNTKQIASQLNVSVKTIETHRLNIMNKLDIHSVAELTKYAIREGVTFLEK